MTMDQGKIQQALQKAGLDGWLFYDFHNRDAISYRILDLEFGKFTSRRWFYYLPARGKPVRLVHRVEPNKLERLPGEKMFYVGWRELHQVLSQILGGAKKIAMQYSPQGAVPYVSTVDAGTIEMVRSFGVEVASSADLVQQFEALLDEAGYRSHVEAGRVVQSIKDQAFEQIGDFIREGQNLTEYELQQWIVEKFEQGGLTCMGELPIVAVNEHAANPHFEPNASNSSRFKPGDMVLIDLWAKQKEPGSVFYDITWCGFVGQEPPSRYREIFEIARRARQAALDLVKQRFSRGEKLHGYEVDDACRSVIEEAGYGKYFLHRTGHSIGEEVHGNGVNLDNLETRDDRLLVPGICFSIEPGIYLEGDMGVRTEINVFIRPDGQVAVEGPQQQELVLV